MMPGASWGDLLAGHVFESRFAAVDAGVMPDRLGAYRRAGFQADRRDWDNSWGEHSRVWSYLGPARARGRLARLLVRGLARADGLLPEPGLAADLDRGSSPRRPARGSRADGAPGS